MHKLVRAEFFPPSPLFEDDGNYVPEPVLAECRKRWPQFFVKHPAWMHVELPEGDPVIDEIISFFRQHGREPLRTNFSRDYSKWNYQMEGVRVFEPADIEAAEYLRGFPIVDTFMGSPRPDGTTEVILSKIKWKPIGSCMWGMPVCSDAFREELEAQAFVGLIFRPVFIKTKKQLNKGLWEMWSDRLMPPLKNRLTDNDGNDFDIPRRRGCRDADFFEPPLLRFDRQAVESLPPFDVALTCERFGPAAGQYLEGDGGHLLKPRLIVSRRVYLWMENRARALEFHSSGIR